MVIILRQNLKGLSFEFEGIYFPAKTDFITIKISYNFYFSKSEKKKLEIVFLLVSLNLWDYW